MANKQVKIKIVTDSNGNAHTSYECEGFGGSSCESVSDLMSILGSVENKEINDDAYNHEIPIPVPVSNM